MLGYLLFMPPDLFPLLSTQLFSCHKTKSYLFSTTALCLWFFSETEKGKKRQQLPGDFQGGAKKLKLIERTLHFSSSPFGAYKALFKTDRERNRGWDKMERVNHMSIQPISGCLLVSPSHSFFKGWQHLCFDLRRSLALGLRGERIDEGWQGERLTAS